MGFKSNWDQSGLLIYYQNIINKDPVKYIAGIQFHFLSRFSVVPWPRFDPAEGHLPLQILEFGVNTTSPWGTPLGAATLPRGPGLSRLLAGPRERLCGSQL